jgi:hypothetical protein
VLVGNSESLPVEQRIAAYTDVWKSVLRRKTTGSAETTGTTAKRVDVTSLFPASSEPTTDTARIENPQAEPIAKTTIDWLAARNLTGRTPSNLHIILYPFRIDDELFPSEPNSHRAVGFHERRGGYPVAFVGMRHIERDEYTMQPLTVGHELGEIITTQMLRTTTGEIGPNSMRYTHPLKEGFCEVLGLDYYRHFLQQQQGQDFQRSYDDIVAKQARNFDLQKLLSDFPYEEATSEEQLFLNYAIAASISSRLAQMYGLEKLVSYFEREASIVRDKDAQHLARHDDFFIRTERPHILSKRKELGNLLQLLGYTPEQFANFSSSSPPLDHRPEGAIAAKIVDQFSVWELIEEDRYKAVPLSDEGLHETLPKSKGPSFLDTVRAGITESVAKEVFGDNFTIDTFLTRWKNDFIQKMYPPPSLRE